MVPRARKQNMDPAIRQRGLRMLTWSRPTDVGLCRDVESYCHAKASTLREYRERLRHVAFNLSINPCTGVEVVNTSNDVIARDTLVGRIHVESNNRQTRFHSMLQDKYDALNDKEFAAIVRCRRCGSEEVTWEEKQTRSADEGATIFCSCSTCKNRWVTRQ